MIGRTKKSPVLISFFPESDGDDGDDDGDDGSGSEAGTEGGGDGHHKKRASKR